MPREGSHEPTDEDFDEAETDPSILTAAEEFEREMRQREEINAAQKRAQRPAFFSETAVHAERRLAGQSGAECRSAGPLAAGAEVEVEDPGEAFREQPRRARARALP